MCERMRCQWVGVNVSRMQRVMLGGVSKSVMAYRNFFYESVDDENVLSNCSRIDCSGVS